MARILFPGNSYHSWLCAYVVQRNGRAIRDAATYQTVLTNRLRDRSVVKMGVGHRYFFRIAHYKINN